MKNGVNLMSEAARLRAALRLRVKHWAGVWALLVTVAAPFLLVRWMERQGTEQERAAREASYEPFSRLTAESRQLKSDAQAFVKTEDIPLKLSRKRSVAALLNLTSKAAATSNGELFVQQVTFVQEPLASSDSSKGKLVIKAVGTLTYDVAAFVEAMTQPPFSTVRVLSTEVESQEGVEQKSYMLECIF
jgi:hypothetical protein